MIEKIVFYEKNMPFYDTNFSRIANFFFFGFNIFLTFLPMSTWWQLVLDIESLMAR